MAVVPTEAAPPPPKGENQLKVPGLPLVHQLKIPEFEWYLGPMYRRYEEILIERARGNRIVKVEKRRAPEIKAPPWEKHVKPEYPKWLFNKTPTDRMASPGKRKQTVVSQKKGGGLVFNS